jgi:hypothetical protein
MNIVAHGLWGVALTPKKKHKRHLEAVFWSVLPDLIWGSVTIPYWFLFDGFWDFADAPRWFYHLYGMGHSVILWLAISGLLFAVGKFRWPLFFWLLHILSDIPGHTNFATPFLYPVSPYRITGTFSWTDLAPETLSFLIPVAIIAWKYRLAPKS